MKKLAACVFVVFIAGCNETHVERSVDFYKENSIDRQEMITQCKANMSELEDSPNCINAQQAENQLTNSRRDWIQPNPIKK